MYRDFAKSLNLMLAGYSYLKSSALRHTYIYGMPPAIGIELTNHCNLKCPECASGSGQMRRKRGFMDLGLFNKVITELGPFLLNVNLYFQGEPLLHPDFYSFIRGSRNIRSVISTNGHLLTEEIADKIIRSGLSKLIISLDGIEQETYSAYRINGTINIVLDGIRNICAAKNRNGSDLKIELQMLVNRINEKEIPRIRDLAAHFNAKLKLKSMQIINKGSFEEWLPRERKYSRYNLSNGDYIIKNPMPRRCSRLWFNPVITWDGKVLPCCFDKDAEHVMGDVTQESFSDIRNGTRYGLFRRVLLEDRSSIEICRNCTSGMRGIKI